MGRFPLKVLIYAIFCVFGAIAMSGCIMEPVSLAAFADDEDVNDTIEKGAGIVNISNGSDANLSPGNGKITGLNPDKYYMVEEWDEYGKPYEGIVSFVSSSGTQDTKLTGIGRVSSGILSGLTNYHHYRVKSAQPLEGNVSYYYLNSATPQTAINNGGIITVQPPANGDYFVFTPPLPPPASIGNYDIVEVLVSPVGSNRLIPASGSISTPAFEGSQIDYVFYDRVIRAFYVLRVVFIGTGPIPPDPDDGLTITIVPYVHPTDHSFTFTPSTANFTQTQAILGLSTLSITADITAFDSIDGWFYNGSNISTGAIFTKSNTDAASIDFTVIGTYVFTFIGIKGTGPAAVPYSGTYTINITE